MILKSGYCHLATLDLGCCLSDDGRNDSSAGLCSWGGFGLGSSAAAAAEEEGAFAAALGCSVMGGGGGESAWGAMQLNLNILFIRHFTLTAYTC